MIFTSGMIMHFRSEIPLVADVEVVFVAVSMAANDDGDVGVVEDVVADAAEKRPPDGAETSATNHDDVSILFLRTLADGMAGVVGGNGLHFAADLTGREP